MPQPRKLDPATLLFWDAQRVTTVEMQRRLAAQGTTASVDLIRLRLREARRNAQGETPAPKPQCGSPRPPTGGNASWPRPWSWWRRSRMTCRPPWTAGAIPSPGLTAASGSRRRSGSWKWR